MPNVIEVRNLHKVYGETVAVDDVSITVGEGEIFGILGPNGAGKTTTVECVEGLRTPDGGSIRVLGLDPQRDRGELTQVLGVQLQDSQLPAKLEVAEALSLYSAFYRNPADWRGLLDMLGLADKARTPFAKLSGGQKQRLSIALALLGSPKVAVLDELTTGLDPQARRDTWDLIEGIRDRGVTVVLVTHFNVSDITVRHRRHEPGAGPGSSPVAAHPHRGQAAQPGAGPVRPHDRDSGDADRHPGQHPGAEDAEPGLWRTPVHRLLHDDHGRIRHGPARPHRAAAGPGRLPGARGTAAPAHHADRAVPGAGRCCSTC